MAVSDNIKQYQKVVDEARDLTKKLQKDLAESFSSGLNHAMGKVEELDKATTRAGKAQKKLYEDSIDLTKDILENVSNIGTEEFKTLDVAKQLSKARKEGDQELIKTLTHLKSINRQQKQQHKQISAMADLAAKPFESIDSFIKEIPMVGDFLAASVGSSGWGEAIRAGVLEGVSSGFTESAMANAGKGLSNVFQTATGNFKLPGMKGPGFKSMENLQNAVGEVKVGILQTVMSNKLLIAGIGLAAVATYKLLVPTVSLANETGLAYDQTRKMKWALLANADAVKAFANEMGTVNNLTGRQSLQLKIQEKLYGLSAESASKLFAVQRGITGMSMDQFLNYTESTAEMARLAGVAPKAVFDDMAQNAEALLLYTDGSADAMSRAAVNAAKYGTSIQDTASMAKGLLDYESAIQKEQEASAVLGKQINFNKSRELILNNQSVEAQRLVVEQIKQQFDWSQLNVMEKELLAEASNMNLATLSKHLNVSEGISKATESTVSSAVMLGAAIGTVAGLAAAIIPSLISTIPGLKGLGMKQLLTGLGIVTAGAAVGGTVGGMIGGFMTDAQSNLPELNDFVMRKGQPPRTFSGDDTLIGTKGPLGTDMTETNKLLGGIMTQQELLLNRIIKTNKDLALRS